MIDPLNNWRKHRADGGVVTGEWTVDPYSTGLSFAGWKQGDADVRVWDDHEALIVWEPRTWLLREGWRRHGLIDWNEVPSANTRRRGRTPNNSKRGGVALEG